jgi:hypothetical protein
MRRLIFLSLLFGGCAMQAQLKIINGNILLEQCTQSQRLESGTKLTEEEFIKATYCMAYIRGVMDTIVVDQLYKIKRVGETGKFEEACFPSTATNEQAQKVVLKYLNDNPANLHLPENILIRNAMLGAFPCH